MCTAGGADSSASGIRISAVRLPSPGHGDPANTAGDSGNQVRPCGGVCTLPSQEVRGRKWCYCEHWHCEFKMKQMFAELLVCIVLPSVLRLSKIVFGSGRVFFFFFWSAQHFFFPTGT